MRDFRQLLASLTRAQRRELAERLAALLPTGLLRTFVVLREGNEVTGSKDIKRHLEDLLPAHALPSQITILEELPRLPNGKIDRRVLARIEAAPAASPEITGPTTDAESTLLAIWQEVLGTDALSIHDDFFEVGGDSILSIQIVSRARGAGLRLSPGDLADHPTVAKLASVASRETDHSESETEADSGPIPLTPIQQWFFDLELAQPEQWNLAMSLHLAPDLEVEAIRAAVEAVVSHHPQLRAGFRQHNRVWLQEVQDDSPRIEFLDPEGTTGGALASDVTRMQRSFRFDGSSLTRFALTPPGEFRRLIVIAHHLVIDHISWGIFLGDLTAALRLASNSQPVALGPATASFSQWARKLRGDHSQPPESELAYWAAPADADCGRLPCDHQWEGDLLEADTERFHSTFDPTSSAQLFKETSAAYNTRVEDLLLTALTRTLARLTGKQRFRIGLERHGRAALGDDIDVSRTIGWFTSYFPFRVSLEGINDSASAIKSVKEQLRGIPRSGIGYGQLLYGKNLEHARGVTADKDTEDVLFNYLGTGAYPGGKAPVRSASPVEQGARAPENRRSHLLEINCSQQAAVLHTEWIFNTRAHRGATVEEWSRFFLQELGDLVAHCLTGETTCYTPSDFPEAGMTQEELDGFLEQL